MSRHSINLDKVFNCIAIEILKESTNLKHNLVILNIYRLPNTSINNES